MDYIGTIFDYHTADGVYDLTITVTDAQGNVYTDTIAIVVLNRTEIDALLKDKWELKRGALAKGKIENEDADHDTDIYDCRVRSDGTV